ncbi:MAG: glutamate mutase L [Proteobacteria bacterium]|nr:glutamate mutase L [Pseudomonadota bacterium]
MNTSIDKNKLNRVLVTDCGSTTTKAVLFEKTASGWRQTFRGEAPTTVEKPVADVTIGARNAFEEVEDLSGRKILNKEKSAESNPIIQSSAASDANGVDLYLSTSSAGGGLQMVVAGVVRNMSTESAERAALGAGAIVMDALSIDDGREQYERVQRIRHLRPDIVLIAGGTDGGTKQHPLEIAEIILQADPRPRFGDTLRLPIIYAANKEAKAEVEEILKNAFSFLAVDNVRPSLEEENLFPAREAIHEIFLNHVMSHAPGYKKLISWSPAPILPTPAAFGEMVQAANRETHLQILAADIGGATTDVFSVIFADEEKKKPVFNRTVSANLGMSYSVANVLLEAGEENILKWLPFTLSKDELRDRLRNKMIRPTSIPQTLEDLIVEQAVCREALRLAFAHHKRLATGLSGTKRQRTIGDIFKQGSSSSLIDPFKLDLIIGSGGVLSHAPDRKSAALMQIDSYLPLGFTRLAVDSIFMMPHLGVFSTIHSEAAAEIFFKECLVELGTIISPFGKMTKDKEILEINLSNGKSHKVKAGEILLIPLALGEKLEVEAVPMLKGLNIGCGFGQTVKKEVLGGHAGLIVDCRIKDAKGNFEFHKQEKDRVQQVRKWYQQFGLSYE